MIIDEIIIEEKENDLNEIILEERKLIPHATKIEITPTTEDQLSNGFFNEVVVKGDKNLEPDNIISSKSIFGVQGTFDCDAKLDLATFAGGANKKYEDLYNVLRGVNMINTDLTGKTSLNYLFNGFSRLTNVVINMKGIKTASYMLGSTAIKDGTVKLLNTDDLEDVSFMFDSCKGITETVDFDTSNVKNFSRMYQSCTNIKTFKKMDCSSAINMSGLFNTLARVANIEGFVNYGKAFTEKTEQYSPYTLDLFPTSDIGHDAIMNVINNLYDLNLTYDVANGGTLYKQKLLLGSSHRNKVSEAEKQIARDKGWIVD